MNAIVRALVAGVPLLGLALSPHVARAQENLPLDEPPPLIAALRGDVGLGSAIGLLGTALVIAPVNNLQVELGTGVGGSGIQLSFMPKVTIGSYDDHFVMGVGVSVAVPLNSASATGHPVWLNVDAAGYEHMSRHGFAFLVAAGFTGGLGGGKVCDFGNNAICDDPTQLNDATKIWIPQFRIGLGHAF